MAGIETSKDLLRQINEERAKGTMQGRVALVIVLAMFGATIGSAWYKITHFDTALLEQSIQRQASAQVWPMVSREIDSIAADAVPALSNALAAEAAAFMPKVSERLTAEGILFQEHVHAKMTSSLDGAFAKAVSDRGDALKARYPQFAADPARYDALIDKLRARSQTWAQAQLDSTFAEHILVLQSINTSVQALGVEAQGKTGEKGADKSMDDVMSLLLEIMNTRLNGKG